MGFQFHRRKLLHQNNEYTIHRGSTSSYSPAPSPSPHQYDSSLSLHNPIAPKFPLFPSLPVHDADWLHTHVLQVAMIVVACTLGFVMLLCTLSIIRRHYYYSRRRNHMRRNAPILFYVNGDSPVSASDGDGPIIDHPIWLIRTEGLQQSVIDSIAVFVYRKSEGLIDGTECSVCLSEFQDDESLRLLPKCSHAFHIPCIDTWLRSHKNCPLCRAPVVHDATVGSGSAEVRRVTVADSSVSVENQEIISTQMENHQLGESEISAARNGGDDDHAGVLSSEDGGSGETLDKVLPIFDKVNCDSSIMIGSHEELEEETQPMRRSVSMDLSSAAFVMFHDVVLDLSCDQDSLEMETQLGDRINSKGKDMKVEKQGSGSSTSTTICKLASIGRVLQKRPISLRSSFSSSSQNRKPLSSRHCRSQSSTLPL